ncbi:hypothetical protein DXC37_08955 [Bifidobacterium bifidum]|uniref:hypothetical protein n=1 Tax=Bifidobacterium bifidum TaxID=1681 RepID=UPI000E44E30C|nr:hypothetical protein [Bifidobacterium bifidum]RGL95052.1 hypothetical protein DXC37_08955 [Bifidobacterium bifidum]
MTTLIDALAQCLGEAFVASLVVAPACAIVAAATLLAARTGTIAKTRTLMANLAVLTIVIGMGSGVAALILHNIALILH